MATFQRNPDEYKALPMLAVAMVIGILLFAVVSLVLYYSGNAPLGFGEYKKTVFVAYLVLAAVVVAIAEWIYSKRIIALKDAVGDTRQKMESYRRILITYLALCELISFSGIVCFMVFGDLLFFIGVAMGLAAIFRKFPSRERIETVLNTGDFKI